MSRSSSAIVPPFGIFAMRTLVIEAFKIPSSSMYPTLQIGDHVYRRQGEPAVATTTSRRPDRVRLPVRSAIATISSASSRSAATPSRSAAMSSTSTARRSGASTCRASAATTSTTRIAPATGTRSVAAGTARPSAASYWTRSPTASAPSRKDVADPRDFPRPDDRLCPQLCQASDVTRQEPVRQLGKLVETQARRRTPASRSSTTSCPPATCSCSATTAATRTIRGCGAPSRCEHQGPRGRHLAIAGPARLSPGAGSARFARGGARPHDVVIVERVAPVAAPLPALLVERRDDRARAHDHAGPDVPRDRRTLHLRAGRCDRAGATDSRRD